MLNLWSKTLLMNSCPYKKEQVIFESAVAGTYEVELLASGKYEVYCIGGGGGGAFQKKNDSDFVGHGYGSAGGGSGAGFIGTIFLSKNNYSIVVGGGGAYSHTVQNQNVTSANGGSSSIDNIVVSAGGNGGTVTRGNGSGGNGGTAPTIEIPVISETLNVSGNKGAAQSNKGSYHIHAAGGASVYNGYGKGGNGNSYHGLGGDGGGLESGTSGYVKIVFKK